MLYKITVINTMVSAYEETNRGGQQNKVLGSRFQLNPTQSNISIQQRENDLLNG